MTKTPDLTVEEIDRLEKSLEHLGGRRLNRICNAARTHVEQREMTKIAEEYNLDPIGDFIRETVTPTPETLVSQFADGYIPETRDEKIAWAVWWLRSLPNKDLEPIGDAIAEVASLLAERERQLEAKGYEINRLMRGIIGIRDWSVSHEDAVDRARATLSSTKEDK